MSRTTMRAMRVGIAARGVGLANVALPSSGKASRDELGLLAHTDDAHQVAVVERRVAHHLHAPHQQPRR